eukprot:jgi/Bigna1/59398/fgenesh1_kg.4_\
MAHDTVQYFDYRVLLPSVNETRQSHVCELAVLALGGWPSLPRLTCLDVQNASCMCIPIFRSVHDHN